MAVTFNTEYYWVGKDSALKLDLTKLDRIQEEKRADARRKEERSHQEKQADKKWFYDMMKVDPDKALSVKIAEEQGKAISEYNDKAGKMLQRNGGNLSDSDKMDLIKDRAVLDTTLNKKVADKERYLKEADILKRDNGFHNVELGLKKLSDWLEKGGDYPTDVLQVKPQDPIAFFKKEALNVPRNKKVEYTTDPVTKITTSRDISEPINQAHVDLGIFQGFKNQGVLLGIADQFSQWVDDPNVPAEEKLRLLDTNKSGTIDPAERRTNYDDTAVLDNPIVKWALQNPLYRDMFNEGNEGASKNIPTGNSGKTSLSFLFGNKASGYIPEKASRATPAPGITVERYHPINVAKPFNLSLKDGGVMDVVKSGAFATERPAGTISVTPLGYDEDSDRYFFKVNDDYANLDLPGIQAGKGNTIAVKRSEMSNQVVANNTEVLDDNGKVVQVGQIKREAPKAVKPSYPDWKKANPKGTVEEYNAIK
jgi:hypothetical protein